MLWFTLILICVSPLEEAAALFTLARGTGKERSPFVGSILNHGQAASGAAAVAFNVVGISRSFCLCDGDSAA